MPLNNPSNLVVRKAVLFGPKKSGKTKLLATLNNITFSDQYDETIGVEFSSIRLSQELKLQLWDTSGDERFKQYTTNYFKKASIGLYCIEVGALDQNRIKQHIDSFKEESPTAPVILIGTKSDIATQNSELERLSQEMNLTLVITSAKSGTGLSDLTGRTTDILCSNWLNSYGEEFAQLQKDIEVVKQIANTLPKARGRKIQQQFDKLPSEINGHNLLNLIESLDTLIAVCELEKNPLITRPIFKLVTDIAIILGSALLGFSIGFGIGFLAGAWTGPGAFISALLVESKLAYTAVTMGVVGGISGGLITHTLFQHINNDPYRKTIKDELLPQLDHIKAKAGEVTLASFYRT